MSDTQAKSIQDALAAFFDPEEVEWKPQSVKGNRALAIAYIDARCVMDRLDAVLGLNNWQDQYSDEPGGSVKCRLSIRVAGEWIAKEDVGNPSDQPDAGDKHKAAFSDALKRAAVKFGVGRYLYSLPMQWVDYDPQKRAFAKTPRLPDKFLPPGSKPAKAQPLANGDAPPKREKTFVEKLTEAGAIFARKGWCDPGELHKDVFAFGVKRNFPSDMEQWTPEQQTLAGDEIKRLRAAAETREAEVISDAEALEVSDLLLKSKRKWDDVRHELKLGKNARAEDLTRAQFSKVKAHLKG